MFENIVKHYHNFPIKGIDFIDVIPFLQDKQVFQEVVENLSKMISTPNIATMEARGFLFASPLLYGNNSVGTVVPLRKKGKLPHAEGDLRKVIIEKEYGMDEMYYRISDFSACKPTGDVIEISLFDDLLATGGTALGIANAINQETVSIDGKLYKLHVKEFVFLIEITNLTGRNLLEKIAPVKSLVHVAEEAC